MIDDDSFVNICDNLKLIKTEDADKIMAMDKPNIMKYYEGLLDRY
jgi:hypothetical protein